MKALNIFKKTASKLGLRRFQTNEVKWLNTQINLHPSRNLTPERLAQILENAERGDLTCQTDLFQDMEEKDAHIFAEMSKRRRAILGLDWSIMTTPDSTHQEKKQALMLTDWIKSIPDFEDILFDMTDAIGMGYSCLEIEWHRVEHLWLPAAIHHRPPRWFQTPVNRYDHITLRDGSGDGAELQPFGWIRHIHKARSGYVIRAGLHRTLAWPYLFKNYALKDLLQLLEIYGLPIKVGKYPKDATKEEKASLLRGMLNIRHSNTAVIPEDMIIEFMSMQGNINKGPFQVMIEWCERSESKAIVGATLTSQTDSGSGAYALGEVHMEVMRDLVISDARQIASTLTRDLIYPLLALNVPDIDQRRLPRMAFDVTKRADLTTFANAIPKLVQVGVKIPKVWIREKLGIPDAAGDEQVLAPPQTLNPAPMAASTHALAALATNQSTNGSVGGPGFEPLSSLEKTIEAINAGEWDMLSTPMVQPILDLAKSNPRQLMKHIGQIYPDLESDMLENYLAQILFVAEVTGQGDARKN